MAEDWHRDTLGRADRGLIGFEFTDSIILHQFSLMEKLIKNSKPTQLYESWP